MAGVSSRGRRSLKRSTPAPSISGTPAKLRRSSRKPRAFPSSMPPTSRRRPKAKRSSSRENSPLKTLADLKGKKVALNKGSNVHFLLVRALENAGVKYSEIEPILSRAVRRTRSLRTWRRRCLGHLGSLPRGGPGSDRRPHARRRHRPRTEPSVLSCRQKVLRCQSRRGRRDPCGAFPTSTNGLTGRKTPSPTNSAPASASRRPFWKWR